MALFNYATKEITLKIVYYGPGLSGKTTNLQQLHSILDPQKIGKLLSLATEADRTLFFDFLPVELGKIKDFSIRFQLYTVPGQVKYNATRKVVLKGADAVVFVADSQREMREANIESFSNMRENLISNNINPDDITLVLQFNKRDLADVLSINELNKDLNISGQVYLEAEAINGKGVQETFQTATKLLIRDISRKHKLEIQPAAKPEKIAPEPQEKVIVPPVEKEKEPAVPEEVEILSFEDPASAIREPIFEAEEIPAEKVMPPSAFEKKLRREPEKIVEEEDEEALQPPPPLQKYEPEKEKTPIEEPLQSYDIHNEQMPEQKEWEMPVTFEIPGHLMEKINIISETLKENSRILIKIKEEQGRHKKPDIDINKEIKEALVPPLEKLDKITAGLKETSHLLISIKTLIKEVAEELKKTKEDQKEILNIIRAIKINEAMERIKGKDKGKKGWFSLK